MEEERTKRSNNNDDKKRETKLRLPMFVLVLSFLLFPPKIHVKCFFILLVAVLLCRFLFANIRFPHGNILNSTFAMLTIFTMFMVPRICFFSRSL